ncbi:hypothetical protein FTO74_04645 [Granulicella sp. WH15]|nr:hypothetical protein FTO74_04645 [Granulicella sp. WH15]
MKFLPSNTHDDFLRLCALSTTGELTSEEEIELTEHLRHCATCKAALIEFEQVVASLLPAIAAESAPEMQDASESDDWSIENAEKALLQAVEQHHEDKAETDFLRSKSQHTNRIRAFAAILAIGATIGTAAYYAHHQAINEATLRKSPEIPVQPRSVLQKPGSSLVAVHPQESASNNTAVEVAELRRRLLHEQSRNAALQNELAQTQDQMNQRVEALGDAVRDRDQLRQQAALDLAEKTALKNKLVSLETTAPDNTDRVKALEAQVTVLNALAEEKDKAIAQEAELLQHDREIRNLMGARNLYIAEIYDVSKTGSTQKPFGRVFYTRDKSLVFYGFDLDQQSHVKTTSVFQAWGRKDAEHDVSLGILYQDDASHNRWVLKFNDAATLAHLDAVFVTIEPSGGSPKPSSKPLLFTYLKLPANHP